MVKISFIYNGKKISMECNIDDELEVIFEKFYRKNKIKIDKTSFTDDKGNLLKGPKLTKYFDLNKEDSEPITIKVFEENCLCHKTHFNYKPFDAYCEKCKEKFCYECRLNFSKYNDKDNHKIILYEEVLENMNNFKEKIKELKDIIDNFNNIKKDNKLLSIKNNLKKYYIIYNNILSNYNKENINYQVICNLNNIKNTISQIIRQLKDILNKANIKDKLKDLEILNNKLENNEIHLMIYMKLLLILFMLNLKVN